MKKLIFKKLTKDLTQFFLIASISITLIIWVIQAVNFLDLVSDDGRSLVPPGDTIFEIKFLAADIDGEVA